jgi:hypothetical protein
MSLTPRFRPLLLALACALACAAPALAQRGRVPMAAQRRGGMFPAHGGMNFPSMRQRNPPAFRPGTGRPTSPRNATPGSMFPDGGNVPSAEPGDRQRGSRTPGAARQRPPLGSGLQRLFQLPPAQREQALRNDRAFQHLPSARQRQLLNGLRRFNAMPPAQQQRVLRRMQDLGRLTPPQRAGLMRVFRQFRAMPPAQRRAFRMAYNNLRQLSPRQRELRLSRPRFQQRFSPQQIQALREALHLDLPPDVVGARPNGGF